MQSGEKSGNLPAAWAFKHLDQHIDSLLQDIWRCHVDLRSSTDTLRQQVNTRLSDADRYWNTQRQRHAQMLLRHPDQSGIPTDHEHDVVGCTSAQAVQGSLEVSSHELRPLALDVPLVSCQIDKADHLRSTFTNLFPTELLPFRCCQTVMRLRVGVRRRYHWLTFWREA